MNGHAAMPAGSTLYRGQIGMADRQIDELVYELSGLPETSSHAIV